MEISRTEQPHTFEFAFRGDLPLDWSEDHDRLLFASLRSDSIQIYEWSRASGEVRAMTSGPEDHSTGCYLPGGRLAVSGVDRAREVKDGAAPRRASRIYVSEPGGGNLRPVTPGPSDTKPACSPDGQVIVYETLDPAGRPSLRP